MCVFQKPLSLRIASFLSPPFGVDVRFQHTADLLLFFTSILAVAVSQVVNSLLQIHSSGGGVGGGTPKGFLKFLVFGGGVFLENRKKFHKKVEYFSDFSFPGFQKTLNPRSQLCSADVAFKQPGRSSEGVKHSHSLYPGAMACVCVSHTSLCTYAGIIAVPQSCVSSV